MTDALVAELAPDGTVVLDAEELADRFAGLIPDMAPEVEEACVGVPAPMIVFAHEYVRDFRGYDAAKRAGFSAPVQRSWKRLLRRPDVSRVVDALVARRVRVLTVSADALVLRLWSLVERGTREDSTAAMASVAVSAAKLLWTICSESGARATITTAAPERDDARERGIRMLVEGLAATESI